MYSDRLQIPNTTIWSYLDHSNFRLFRVIRDKTGLDVHGVPLGPGVHKHKLLVSRNRKQGVGRHVGDDPRLAEDPVDLILQTVLQPLDWRMLVRLRVSSLILQS